VKRKIIVGVLLGLLFFILAAARVVYSSRDEYLRAGRYLALGHIEQAIVHYRRAARWYAPGNPYVEKSIHRLWELGKLAERRGNPTVALTAYRSIRGAILGTRSFYTPNADWLERVNKKIAELMAAQGLAREKQMQAVAARTATNGAKKQTRTQAKTKGAQRKRLRAQGELSGKPDSEKLHALERWHIEQLKKDHAPSVGWSVVAVFGLILWIAAGFAFAYRAISPEDKLLVRPAIICGGCVVVGLAMWMTGLAMA
jgi:hypothetical protein